MTLRQQRILFTGLKNDLIQWIRKNKWSYGTVEIAEDEGMVHSPRPAKYKFQRITVQDGVHKFNSFHHRGLAVDLLLYINGTYVTSGEHPIWKEIDNFCRELDPMFGLGISFNDANHLSLGESDG